MLLLFLLASTFVLSAEKDERNLVINGAPFARVYERVHLWLVSEYAAFIDDAKVGVSFSKTMGAGLVAKTAIAPDTLIMRIPVLAHLNWRTLERIYPVLATTFAAAYATETDASSERNATSSFHPLSMRFNALCATHLGLARQSDTFAPHAALLGRCSLPIDWRAPALRGLEADVRARVTADRAHVNAAWRVTRQALAAAGRRLGHQMWQWGFCHCLSRNFVLHTYASSVVPIAGLPNHADAPTLAWLQDTRPLQPPPPSPLNADKNNVDPLTSLPAFELRSVRDRTVRAGEPLTIHYGAHTDERWLAMYGFFHPSLRHARRTLSLRDAAVSLRVLRADAAADADAVRTHSKSARARLGGSQRLALLLTWSRALAASRAPPGVYLRQPVVLNRVDDAAWPPHVVGELLLAHTASARFQSSLAALEAPRLASFELVELAMHDRLATPAGTERLLARWQSRLCRATLRRWHAAYGDAARDADAIAELTRQIDVFELRAPATPSYTGRDPNDAFDEWHRRRSVLYLRQYRRASLRACVDAARAVAHGRGPAHQPRIVRRLTDAAPTFYVRFNRSGEETSPWRPGALINRYRIVNHLTHAVAIHYVADSAGTRRHMVDVPGQGGQRLIDVRVGNRLLALAADGRVLASTLVIGLAPFTIRATAVTAAAAAVTDVLVHNAARVDVDLYRVGGAHEQLIVSALGVGAKRSVRAMPRGHYVARDVLHQMELQRLVVGDATQYVKIGEGDADEDERGLQKNCPVTNAHSAPVKLWWINEEGKQVAFDELAAGEQVNFELYVGHVIVAEDATTGEYVSEFMVEPGVKQYIIKRHD